MSENKQDCKCCSGETIEKVTSILDSHRLFLDNGDRTYTEIKFQGCQPRRDDLHFKKIRTITHEEYVKDADIGIFFVVLK